MPNSVQEVSCKGISCHQGEPITTGQGTQEPAEVCWQVLVELLSQLFPFLMSWETGLPSGRVSSWGAAVAFEEGCEVVSRHTEAWKRDGIKTMCSDCLIPWKSSSYDFNTKHILYWGYSRLIML